MRRLEKWVGLSQFSFQSVLFFGVALTNTFLLLVQRRRPTNLISKKREVRVKEKGRVIHIQKEE